MILLIGVDGKARNAAAGRGLAGGVAMTVSLRYSRDENGCCPPVSVREI